MATIKVKVRPSSIQGKAGTIYYQVCHGQQHCQLTTKIRVKPTQWDADNGCIRISDGGNRDLSRYQCQIDNDVKHLRKIISGLEHLGSYTLSDVVSAFRSRESSITVLAYIRTLITQLRNSRKLGTALNYERTLNSFSLFLGGNDIPFSLFNEVLVAEYNEYLAKRDVVKNTVSFYNRVLRAVYNKAVRQHLTEQNTPFQNVYTGIDRTRKRAVDEQVVMRLQQLDLSGSLSLALARDLFVFSYCTRGMSFIDIAFLRKADIEGGFISYCRHKTGQRLTIRIEPCIRKIVDCYRIATAATPHVFPIITSSDPETAFRQYHTAIGYHNRKLKRLADLVGLEIPLSSYTARHTWATTARNYNIPLSVISAGMGHSSEKTTQIYLASLENTVIDEANQSLLTEFNKQVSL